MSFVTDFKPPEAPDDTALWFFFRNGRMMTVPVDGTHRPPTAVDLDGAAVHRGAAVFLGRLDGRCCFAAQWPEGRPVPEGMALNDLRALFDVLDQRFLQPAGLANQLILWHDNHRFCGRCGRPTEDKPDERAKQCTGCGLINYPRLSPAVIVAVIRGDRILLARNKRFRAPFFSVLAGFVEPGETLEDCIHREVLEEVGIRVGRLRYFGSQPWPFPDSLMVGFTAEYRGGDISVDNSEIVEAGWFTRDDLPRVPPAFSIAGSLIARFVDGRGRQ